MIGFLPADVIESGLQKLFRWMGRHHLFLILPSLSLLLSLGLLACGHFRTPPTSAPFTLDAQPGDYCYTDVQELSNWLLKTTGGQADCFYLAVGTDDSLRLLSMNDVLHEDIFGPVTGDTALPEPRRVEGIVKPMAAENQSALMDALDLTESQYAALLGGNYLDLREDPNGNLTTWGVYLLGASLILLALNAIAFFEDRQR